MNTIRKKYFGDRQFYKMVLLIAVPIMIQNGITNFVNLLDNVMVGRIGTEQMSGVAIVNQLLFVYNLMIFGGVSGAGIFTAQYYGCGDHKGVRYTFRFKLLLGIILTGAAGLLFLFGGERLILLYLGGDQGGSSAALALISARSYLGMMMWGLPAFMVGQVYSGTLRDCGETVVPMKAGLSAVFVNLILNYLLIYGKFGFPEMGVVGAALATVISRYVEVAVVAFWVHSHAERNPFIRGAFRSPHVPAALAGRIVVKGVPLLVNETLWAAGIAFLLQCYSVRGLNVVAGMNVCNTIMNVFNVVFIALGDSVAIVVGQLLGAGKMEEAVDTDRKMIVFSVLCCTAVAFLMAGFSPFFPKFYNINPESRVLASCFILIAAFFLPKEAFLHATYFTIRCGGKTLITFLFDSVFICCVTVPAAFLLSRFTALDVRVIFILIHMLDFIKCIIGTILVKKGVWIQNLVAEEAH